MKKHLLNLIVFFALNACGPSAADISQAEQAGKEELLRQQEHEKQQKELKNLLINLRAKLAGEETKLESIERFQLFRMADEKAQQVTDQTRVIEELRSEIANVENQIDN